MTDDTERKRRMAKVAHLKPHQFQPGVPSANPSGRPKGARNKLTETFLEDVYEVWQEHGKQVLTTLAEKDPGKLATIVAGLLPKDVHINFGLGEQLADMLEKMQDFTPEVVNGSAAEIIDITPNGDAVVTSDDDDQQLPNDVNSVDKMNS